MKYVYVIVIILILISGFYLYRPDVCKDKFCNGDRVYVPSTNLNGTITDCCTHQSFNVWYDEFMTTPNFPGKQFKLQTKGFGDVVKLSNNLDTCVGIFNKREGC